MQTSSHNHYQAQAVTTANPAQLVLMLYDGALASMVRARMAEGQPGAPEALNRELMRAHDILNELQLTLDTEQGGPVAANLASLYDFCLDRLLSANLTKDLSRLDEVESVVRQLRDTWEEACCRGMTLSMVG